MAAVVKEEKRYEMEKFYSYVRGRRLFKIVIVTFVFVCILHVYIAMTLFITIIIFITMNICI
jgi:hypothetical protein